MSTREAQKDKWAARFFIGYITIGILPSFFYDAEFNVEFAFAFKYLTLPFILLWYLLTGTVLRKMFKGEHILLRIFAPLVLGVVCALGSGGYVSAVNVVVGPQVPVTVKGRVIEKGSIGSKSSSRSYYLDIGTGGAEGVDTIQLNIQKKY